MRPAPIAPVLALLAALLAACAPAPPPPTTVALTIVGTPGMNGSRPAKVQVLYLASAARFQTSDFFALSGAAQATLGADLVAVDEYLLAPGTTQADAKSFAQPVTHVGVVVGFGDISTAAWRAVAPLKANAPNPVTVTVQPAAVTVAPGS